MILTPCLHNKGVKSVWRLLKWLPGDEWIKETWSIDSIRSLAVTEQNPAICSNMGGNDHLYTKVKWVRPRETSTTRSCSCEAFRANLDVENKMVIPEAEEAMGEEGWSTVDPQTVGWLQVKRKRRKGRGGGGEGKEEGRGREKQEKEKCSKSGEEFGCLHQEILGRRDGSAVRGIQCSHRGPWFTFQLPHQVTQNSLQLQFQGIQWP